VSKFYSDTFVHKLAENSVSDTPPLAALYRPKRSVANYFQYHYLINNPYPLGQRDLLTNSEADNTIYSKFHRFYHSKFRNLSQEFNFYDLFLIDIKSLNINYSIFKETDFATSLIDGPYQDSGLGILAKRIQAEPKRGNVLISDFSSYTPSFNVPAAFVGAPIFDRNEVIGILAIQLPTGEINRAMTYSQNWSENGLGSTGETYLIGEDGFMRSDSRLLIEDEERFFNTLEKADFLPQTIKRAKAYKTTSTIIPVSTISDIKERYSSTQINKNYLGESVLSSYAPLNITGLNWSIVSEITEKEAFKPISQLQRTITVWGVVLIMTVALLSMLVSRNLIKPIEKLTEGVSRLRSDCHDVHVEITSNDEFGDLANNFNAMVSSIREKSEMIQRKTRENDLLLLNILPEIFIDRYKSGEIIADDLQQVSIAYLHVIGLSKVSSTLGAVKSATYLHELIDQLDNLGQRYEVEKVKTIGGTFIAGCGLTYSRLDHSQIMLEYASDALKLLKKFNHEHNTKLQMKIGIASGPIVSAVVGTRQFHYELWGEAVEVAARIRFEAEPGTIVVSEEVERSLQSN